uniref:Uncharacterized protein n=1 Tax=Arundo donax TaxID=35708 RepID=A0A0A8XZM5_ARUDO
MHKMEHRLLVVTSCLALEGKQRFSAAKQLIVYHGGLAP